MPPQQGQTLLDLFHQMPDLGSHGGLRCVAGPMVRTGLEALRSDVYPIQATKSAPFSTAAPGR
jgi:hypothetical protein